jgi:hypothetical protein
MLNLKKKTSREIRAQGLLRHFGLWFFLFLFLEFYDHHKIEWQADGRCPRVINRIIPKNGAII